MKIYLDTSALVKLYYPEAESSELAQWLIAKNVPLPFTPLHELELKNAVALKVFQKEIRPSALKAVINMIDADFRNGVLLRQDLSWGKLFADSILLSLRYTPGTGTRSLDILHIATALACECSHFLSFDRRQTELAVKTGLKQAVI